MTGSTPGRSAADQEGEPVASERQTESTAVKHPVLGPAVEIYCDRRLSWGALFLALAFLCVALLGFILGAGDLSGSSSDVVGLTLPPILGLAELAGAAVVAGWSLRSAGLAIGRIRGRPLVVVGRDGFEYLAGDGPVSWDEVESISDPGSPDEQPRTLRVQLKDSGDYARRHALSPIGRVIALVSRGDLVIGRDTIMPMAEVQALMRRRLVESRGIDQSSGIIPAAAQSRRSGRRRQAPKK
jgi:hypothetical protein